MHTACEEAFQPQGLLPSASSVATTTIRPTVVIAQGEARSEKKLMRVAFSLLSCPRCQFDRIYVPIPPPRTRRLLLARLRLDRPSTHRHTHTDDQFIF